MVQPDSVLVGWDTLEVPTYRHESLPGYQAGRVFEPAILEQLGLLPALVGSFGFLVGKAPGYEADDFLAAGAGAWPGPVLVATSDRDAFQLVSDRINILQPVKGVSELARVGPAEVRSRYGVDPGQVPDFIALRGDPSDHIPGAPGIGPKKAADCSGSTARSRPRSPQGGSRRSPTTCACTGASRRWTPARPFRCSCRRRPTGNGRPRTRSRSGSAPSPGGWGSALDQEVIQADRVDRPGLGLRSVEVVQGHGPPVVAGRRVAAEAEHGGPVEAAPDRLLPGTAARRDRRRVAARSALAQRERLRVHRHRRAA